jgi:hypothetical protein
MITITFDVLSSCCTQDENFIKVFYESKAKYDPKQDAIGSAVDIDEKLMSLCFFKLLLPRSTLSSVLAARSLRKTKHI